MTKKLRRIPYETSRDAEYDAVCEHDNDGNVHEMFFKTFFKSFK